MNKQTNSKNLDNMKLDFNKIFGSRLVSMITSLVSVLALLYIVFQIIIIMVVLW